MKFRIALILVVVSVFLVGGLNIAPVGAAMFMGLGDLEGGSFGSDAFGVSADGHFVVGLSFSTFGTEAFRWSASEGMIGLGDFPGGGSVFNSEARAVSADGSVVVGRGLSDNGFEAFRWTAASGMVPLGDSPGLITSYATGVSGNGSVVVGGNNYCCIGPAAQAWSWTEDGGFIGLGDLPGGNFRSNAWGVSADGSVVVGDSISDLNPSFGLEEAFRWTEASDMVGLGIIAGKGSSAALAISANSLVIVGYSSLAGFGEASRWTEATGMIGLGHLPGGEFGRAEGVSANGAVIVGGEFFGFLDSSEAFIWKSSFGMRALKDFLVTDMGLNLTGWTLTEARGISADGLTIVGNGVNPNGLREAWIAKLDSQSQNLNDHFAPLGPGDVAIAFSRTPCGGAAAGTFTITATFTNISSDTLTNLVIAVNTLTGGNVLCNADGGPGGTGSQLTVPLEGDLADGQLSPGEAFVVELPIGLQSFNPFTFIVDVLGEEEAP